MIRKFRESDREVLKEITAICFDGVCIDQNIEKKFGLIDDKDWKWRKVRHIDVDIAANGDGIFVCEEAGKVVGYITTQVDEGSKIGSIPNISVLPGYQRRGIGRQLMERAFDYFREEGMAYAKIETLAQNEVGQRFYPKMGFQEVALQIHYVRPL